jgi:hypothetical protein
MSDHDGYQRSQHAAEHPSGSTIVDQARKGQRDEGYER